jgi:hypothetical protein
MSLPSIPIRSLSARLFWLAMLAGHLPATSAALAGDASALRAAILLLSQSFFVLKLLDVPWLRLPADRRRLIAVIAVIALLHARVVESSLPRDVNTYAAWHVVAVVGSVSAVALLLLVRRRAERLRRDSPPRLRFSPASWTHAFHRGSCCCCARVASIVLLPICLPDGVGALAPGLSHSAGIVERRSAASGLTILRT